MEYKDLKTNSANELKKILAEERGKLFDLQLKLSVNQLKDIRAVRKVKKNIAMILTKIKELESRE